VTTSLFWFTNDLRLRDNQALALAAAESDSLLCVYIVDPKWFQQDQYGLRSLSNKRALFLKQALDDLDASLQRMGQQLHVLLGSALDLIPQIITRLGPRGVYRSENAGYYENQHWTLLKQRYPQLCFKEVPTHTLFSRQQLPFSVDDLPSTFSKFRKAIESGLSDGAQSMSVSDPVTQLPPGGLSLGLDSSKYWTPNDFDLVLPAQGGETAGQAHCEEYFQGDAPLSYKETRNALDGWSNSSKFSLWLASGCLSVSELYRRVEQYEIVHHANESTYWLKFELLWREYFQWLAHKNQHRSFTAKGEQSKCASNCFYPERFQRWIKGNTPYHLVNACMKQLAATGYMSNRGRQIAASCLLNELGLDWRVGAAYFEEQLLDYDVASNWGNWQYLAGVGADPRGGRHFNIEKQASIYDPDGRFVEKWQGQSSDGRLDSVDAADWPIMP